MPSFLFFTGFNSVDDIVTAVGGHRVAFDIRTYVQICLFLCSSGWLLWCCVSNGGLHSFNYRNDLFYHRELSAGSITSKPVLDTGAKINRTVLEYTDLSA
ncbi:hypothetical protein M758_4G201400 [Ceratodon purpureus]|nr:hypothetical protein M758_4G201400 [Ceratodon purpureus]